MLQKDFQTQMQWTSQFSLSGDSHRLSRCKVLTLITSYIYTLVDSLHFSGYLQEQICFVQDKLCNQKLKAISVQYALRAFKL